MKLRENHCSQCYTKIVQKGKGRTATLCAGCRAARADEYRAGKKTKAKEPGKFINPVGDDAPNTK